MERRITKIIFTISICLLIINCSTMGRKGLDPFEYNRLVWESKIGLEISFFNEIKEIVGNNPIAVYAIVNKVYNQEYSSYYERHISEQSRIVVATRRTDVLDHEFNFQYSGMVSDDEMRSIGRMLGVNYILVIDASLPPPPEYPDNSSNATWAFTLYEIEKGFVLFSATDAIVIHREIINRNYYLKTNKNNTSTNNSVSPFIHEYPFYYQTPIAEIEIDFGGNIGVCNYWGFRPTKEEFSLVINGQYFRDGISPGETLISNSYVFIENNTSLDERVKAFMRVNNLTFCGTLINNDYGGFTYIVNYSFDNYVTFGFVSMDTFGYDPSRN